MLIEYTCDNFRSIKNKVSFSFLASTDDTNENKLRILEKNLRISRMASIYGANGSGKSTLMKILAGLDTPDSGTIWVNKEIKTANIEDEKSWAKCCNFFGLEG